MNNFEKFKANYPEKYKDLRFFLLHRKDVQEMFNCYSSMDDTMMDILFGDPPTYSNETIIKYLEGLTRSYQAYKSHMEDMKNLMKSVRDKQ